jgi:hypothetical protein
MRGRLIIDKLLTGLPCSRSLYSRCFHREPDLRVVKRLRSEEDYVGGLPAFDGCGICVLDETDWAWLIILQRRFLRRFWVPAEVQGKYWEGKCQVP